MFEVLKYIHENITKPLKVDETALRFGYSKWYFSNKFRQYTGKTFTEYVRSFRVQSAALDILQGKKVLDVSLEYGYETPGGFSKAFLAEYGCLPREYVKKVKESQLYYERRRVSMFHLSDRCAKLRDEVVNNKHYVNKFAVQRIVYYTLGLLECQGKDLANEEIEAHATCNVIKRFTPVIAPGELIVGYNFGDGEIDDYYIPENSEKDLEMLRSNFIPEADIERYYNNREKAYEYAGFKFAKRADYTEDEYESEEEWSSQSRGIDSNHSVIGYERVLKLGFDGLLKEVEELEERNGSCALYNAAKELCKTAGLLGDKYCEKAKELLALGDPDYNNADLETIIQVCANVPSKPAASFIEAVQSIWFAHIINTWEDTINANSIGHLDQILYPYYRHDIDNGIITKEEAFEILCCLWIKLYRDYDVQQACLGGMNPDGSTMVNELSYLMLDVTERLEFIRCLSVRFSPKTEKAFLRRALEVVGHLQKGVPFFFNDDVMIPALVEKGISYEDACNYTQIGCVETVIPGKSNPHAVTGGTNLLKSLEYTFGNGQSMMNPQYNPGLKTGDIESFDTYEKFYDALLKQIAYTIELACSKVKKCADASAVNAPKPYKSLLTEGCLESKRHFNDFGAIYDYYQVCIGGIPNVADSLAVIKKFVYDEKKYTLAQLKTILEEDFPDESVRMEFVKKAPKFGNNIASVDQIACDITNFSCDVLEDMSEKYGISFHAQPFTFLWMVDQGERCAASPDGRRKGEIIAYSVSPMQGRDFNGLTALFNSISCLPTKRAPGSTSAIVEVDPKLFTDSNIDMLTDILIASAANGLCNVQYNTIDADTLIDAQKNPEKYNNLAVRVSGFSQKFNLLTPQLQNHIIGRTKHACM